MKELIKQALIQVIGKSSGLWGLVINYLADFIYKWGDIILGREYDKIKGKKQSKEIKNATTDVNDAFDKLD